MIKRIAAAQIILGLVSTAILFFVNEKVALTSAVTTFLLIVNLFGLYFFWRVVFFKKSIALGLLIIIFKYPLIAFCLWQISKQNWIAPIGVFISILLFLISTVGCVVYTQRRGHAF